MTQCIGDNTLVEFLEGSVREADAARLERHVNRCGECAERLRVLGTSPSRVDLDPTPPVVEADVSTCEDIIIDVDTSAVAPAVLAPGTRVGHFEILRELGRGGMGVVYAARDRALDRPVALKLLHAGGLVSALDELAQERLLAEARAMARLHHGNIVAVYEAGRFRRQTYIVMELVDGETLGTWLARWNARDHASILRVFCQAGQALAHAHAHGLAHGDFKPDNVLIDDHGRVRVADFGLACRIERAYLPAGHDRPGWVALPEGVDEHPVMGTPRYMAPEQFRGRPADAHADQFGFCVALFQALYGRHPFAGGTSLALLELPRAQATAPLRAGADDLAEVPRWLYQALCKGLSLDPADRFESMDALLAALEPPARRGTRRVPGWALAIAAVALLCTTSYALGVRYPTAVDRRAVSSVGDRPTPEAPATMPGGIDGADLAGAGIGPEVSAFGDVADLATDVRVAQFTSRFGAEGSSLDAMVSLYGNSLLLLDDEIRRREQGLARLRSIRAVLASLTGAAPASTPLDPLDSRPLRGHRDDKDGARRMAVAGPDVRVRARSNGLGADGLRTGIDSRRRDLEVCFREWRARKSYGRPALSVRVDVDPTGRASARPTRGLDDAVVRKCVAGALERAAFPSAEQSTRAHVRFESDGAELHIESRLLR
ncbi:protein kinase domain-containing protein [Haliangium sp.]|uniref:serine/threonine-protein kinase n=1 Tax=Haliangium sp. TaxID=2663208 RepID=UPI003D0EDF69